MKLHYYRNMWMLFQNIFQSILCSLLADRSIQVWCMHSLVLKPHAIHEATAAAVRCLSIIINIITLVEFKAISSTNRRSFDYCQLQSFQFGFHMYLESMVKMELQLILTIKMIFWFINLFIAKSWGKIVVIALIFKFWYCNTI